MFSKFYSKNDKIIPSFIYGCCKKSRSSFLNGFLEGDGHENVRTKGSFKISQKSATIINGLLFLCQDIFTNITLNYVKSRFHDNDIYFKLNINKTSVRKFEPNILKKIETYNYDGFVYDIETENHHFCGGIGNVNLHNSFFIDYEKNNYKVGCTDVCKGKYIGTKEGEYGKLRQLNWATSWVILQKKYNLKQWISYKNLEIQRNI